MPRWFSLLFWYIFVCQAHFCIRFSGLILRVWFSYAFLDRFFKRLVFVRVLGQVFKEARFRVRFRSGFLRGSFPRCFF